MKFYNDLVPHAGRLQTLPGGYYNGMQWHRVENWVIQTGNGPTRDPIALEISRRSRMSRGRGRGAHFRPKQRNDQFLHPQARRAYLDGNYSVFGTSFPGWASWTRFS